MTPSSIVPISGTEPPRPFARRERDALCDLVLELGAHAPTLCEGWTTRDLVEHLLVRERRPWAAVGVLVPRLSFLTRRETARLEEQDLADLVARLRRTAWTPVALPLADTVANSLELFVHHEDVRRAQADWSPRRLSRSDQDSLWKPLRLLGRLLVRPAGVPVRISRTDVAESATLRGGGARVTVTGLPSEIAMFLTGRDQHQGLRITGPPGKVAALRAAGLGM